MKHKCYFCHWLGNVHFTKKIEGTKILKNSTNVIRVLRMP